MIVRRFMNKTGVIKDYLIGTRCYAYRLNFRIAAMPDWVITTLNSLGERAIGFEEETTEESLILEGQLPNKDEPT